MNKPSFQLMVVHDSLNLSKGIIAEIGYILKNAPLLCTLFFFVLLWCCGFIFDFLQLMQADEADTQADSSIVRGR